MSNSGNLLSNSGTFLSDSKTPPHQQGNPSLQLKNLLTNTGTLLTNLGTPSQQPSFRNWETLLQQLRDPFQEALDMFPPEEPSLILDLSSSSTRNHFSSCAREDHFLQTSMLTTLNVA